MLTNVMVGNSTLNCANKIANSNISIGYLNTSHLYNISSAGRLICKYPNKTTYINTVIVPDTTSILVKLYFGMEKNFDFLYVYQGSDTTTQIGQYTGDPLDSPQAYSVETIYGTQVYYVELVIPSNAVTFKFISDPMDQGHVGYGYYAVVYPQ